MAGSLVAPAVFPLSVSSGRFLRTAAGAPFPVFMDSAWWAAFNLSPADQYTYLADRLAKGFTATLVPVFEHKGTLNKPPLDFVSNLPFLKRLDGATYTGSPNGTTGTNGNAQQFSADNYSSVSTQAPDFTFPNPVYWARLKSFFDLCSSFGFAIVAFACYHGFGGTDEGWSAEMIANDAVTGAGGQVGQPFANASKSLAWNYGAWLATQFAGYSNIIWVHGGDNTVTGSDKAAVDSIRLGMQSVTGALSKLDTAHWARGTSADAVSLTSGAFSLQSVYTGNTDVATVPRTAYAAAAGPIVIIENRYDGNASGSDPWRQYWWPTTCSGAAGSCYGNDGTGGNPPLYEYQATYTGQLNSQGAQDMASMHAFMRARPWWRMVPSGVSGAGTVVTANGGTSGTSNYVAACVDSSATCLYLYIPPPWALGTITVDLSLLSSAGANAICRWYDPLSRAYSSAGTFATSGTHTFTPPGNNSSGSFTDWVLLAEAAP